MEMTNSEIVRSYREAKDKGKQVKILSQLNLCEVGEILDILAKNGVKPQEMPRMRRAKVKTEVSEAPPPKRRTKIRQQRAMRNRSAKNGSTEMRCWSTSNSWSAKQAQPRRSTSPKSGSSTADEKRSISSLKSWEEAKNAV